MFPHEGASSVLITKRVFLVHLNLEPSRLHLVYHRFISLPLGSLVVRRGLI